MSQNGAQEVIESRRPRPEDGRTAWQHDRTAPRPSRASRPSRTWRPSPTSHPAPVPVDRAARAVLRPLRAGSRGPLLGRHPRGRAPGAAPGRRRPAQRGRHQHLLGPLPRHLLAALDGGRRGRGDRPGQRHRPRPAHGVGREQGVAHRRRRGRARRRRARRCGWSRSSTGSSTAAASGWS